jgi:DNA-binding transcriptional ArsR family regulator
MTMSSVALTPDAREVERLAELFSAIGDPTRLRILHALEQKETCVGDLSAGLDLSESAISHQLGLLRALRLVRARREGRHVYYRLDDNHVSALISAGMEHVSERR